MKQEEDYVPFGDEWEKEMSKLPKAVLIEMYRKLASTPKVNLVEVEKLVQNKVDFLYGMDDTGSRKGCVDYLRQLCNYTLSDLTSDKEEGR